jgi:hypothetical protein
MISWQVTIFLSVIVIWGSRLAFDWFRLRAERSLVPAPAPEPTRCLHLELEPIAAKPLTSDHALPYHQTILLKRCKGCGAHSTEGHPGFWQTADFMRTKADDTWLKEQLG